MSRVTRIPIRVNICLVRSRIKYILQLFLNNRCELVYFCSNLLCGISIANCDRVVFQCLKIDRYTVWSSDFILGKIALADVAAVVP